jgi:hypothetical protein
MTAFKTTHSSYTVGFCFQRLIATAAPSATELSKAQSHAGMIRGRLAQRFELQRVRPIGSHWKGTAIRDFSDVDLLAVMSRDEARKWARDENSSTLLMRVRNDLQERFRSTIVRRDGQACVINFARGEYAVDVVPAIFGRVSKSVSYYIPDGDGGWLETFPDAEKQFLQTSQARSGNKLISLIRLIKWWAWSRTATAGLKSRYVENLIPRSRVMVGMSYQEALAHVFSTLQRYGCKPLTDSTALSNEVTHIASTDQQRRIIAEVVETAADRADRALYAEGRGHRQEAIRLWSMIFNGQFPVQH